jgi:hypothetical protein
MLSVKQGVLISMRVTERDHGNLVQYFIFNIKRSALSVGVVHPRSEPRGELHN